MIKPLLRLLTKLFKSGKTQLDHGIRCDRLARALYDCGIPWWVACRNARAFMVLRPDFDLDSPKFQQLRELLEYHQDLFLDAMEAIASTHGLQAAHDWVSYIRSNDIFWARIVSLPDDFATQYLFA